MLINDWLRFLKQGRFATRGQLGTRAQRANRRSRRARSGDWAATTQTLESRVLLSAANDPPIASPVFINVLEDSGTQLIQLLGADGDVEFDQQLTYALTGSPAHGTLSDFNPVAGTVLYTPDPNYQGPDSFTYTVSDDGATVLSLIGTVSGTIPTPGAYDTYSFTLPVDSQLYFDSLTGSNTLFWTLTGPAGEITRNFDNSDAFYPILKLPAGDYSLKIAGAYDATGAYQFRLFNLDSAASLPIGSQINGTLNPVNETDLYKFNAVAGNRFQFDAFPTSEDIANSWWRLIDPYGNELAGSSMNGGDFGPITFTNSGTYTLLIEGHPYETGVSGGYSFLVSQLPDDPIPPVTGTPLSLGVVSSGSIVVPDETYTYTFNLPAKAQLYFDSLTSTDSAIIWELTGPAGTINNDFLQADVLNGSPVMSLVAGDYALTISRNDSGTGPYEFRLLDLAEATQIVPGTPVSGTLAPTNETEMYSFSGIAGEKFYFDADPISGDIISAGWRLIDPYGNVVAYNFLNGGDLGPITLPISGTFTVLIEGNPYETGTSGDYAFNLVPVMTSSAVMTLGSTISGTLATPGSSDTYTFTLLADLQLYFDSLSGDSQLSWTLTGPSGVITQTFAGSDYLNPSPLLNLPAGSYSLKINRSGDSTGPYQFRLIDIDSASALPIGSLMTGTLNPVNETDLYQFNAVAGNRFQFDALPITGDISNATWRLIDPYGNVLGGNILNEGDFGPVTLTNSGTFTLLIEGYVDEIGVSGGYSFLVSQLPDDPIPPVIGTPLSLGSLTSGSIDVADETKTYTFNLSVNSLLYFDSITSTESALYWELTGPAGTVQNSFILDSTSPVMNLVAGDYALTISRSDSGTGPYEFRLLDLADATPIVPGTPVTGTLAPTNETDLYKFSGMAGETFYFDADLITGDIFNAYWRLIDPYGNELAGNFLNGSDLGSVTLPNSGTFTLLIEGHPYEGGTSGDYAFNVVPVITPAPVSLTSSPSTSTVSVVSVNDAPGGANATLTTPEDLDLTFAAGDFGFTDPNDSPANALLAVKITTLPAAGTLKFNGTPVNAGDFIPVAGITGGQLKFTPATNVFGSPYASFTFQVQDNGGISNGGGDLDQSPNTLSINVTSVNDAPAGTNAAVWIYEETEHVFTTANFGFTDPNDSPSNTLLAVKITTLPAAGTVRLNGTPVTAGQFIPVASITAGDLKYVAAPNLSNASFGVTFQVQDNGGIANGGVDLDQSSNLFTINILQVNDAPLGANATLSIDKNTEHVFTTANFGFTDPNDSPANTLLAVKITTLPAAGTLTLNGNPVTAGDFIPVASITGGQFKFTPAPNGIGEPYSSFTFQVQDNGGIANGGVDLDQSPNTITFNVQQVYIVPAGSEFRVNTWTTGIQIFPSTAMDAAGNFVVTWMSNGQDGSGYGVYAQRYNAAGTSQGGEFRVNTSTTSDQKNPTIAMDAAGNFVITWMSDGQDGSSSGVYAQRFNSSGTPQGGEFRVNTWTFANQYNPSIAMDTSGDFVITWDSYNQDGSGNGVYAQRYHATGTPQGGEFRVNTWTTGNQGSASVAMDSDGDFVITWKSYLQDTSSYGVYAKRYNAMGVPQGGEFLVNTGITNSQDNPSIAVDADGDFVITWMSNGQDGSSHGVYAQRYNSAGVPQGGEFRVNTWTTNAQHYPAIATDSTGNFVVTWVSLGQDGNNYGIYAQRYNSAGVPQGGEFRVNTWTTNTQHFPAIAMDSTGDFVVTWTDGEQDGSSIGIYAQRFMVANQTPTGINLSNNSAAENLPVGTPVGLFSTIDPDIGNTFTYTLVPGSGASGNAAFTIVGNELRTAAVFDYESVNSYSIRVRTTDQGGEWFEQTFTISVTAVGAEFRVNTWTADYQSLPVIATDLAGNFVVSWMSGGGQDGSGYGVYAQRYNASGLPQGPEFRVNSYTTGDQVNPSIAMDDTGNFVISWESNGQDGSGYGIYAQRYNAAGVPQGGEFQVSSYTTGNQSLPSIAMESSGDFVITWESEGQDGNFSGIFAKRYDALGLPLGGEFLVNSHTTGNQNRPSVGMDANGDFVIAWQSYGQDGSNWGVYAQRYDAAGLSQGGEFLVNTVTTNFQRSARVAMDASGAFVITWMSLGQDGSSREIYAQRYNAGGVPQGGEFLVNSYTTGLQGYPTVSMDSDGDFVIAWASDNQDGSAEGVYAQRFNSSGTPQGPEFRVNNWTTDVQYDPSVAMNGSGDFIVAWASRGQDGSAEGVYARRFNAPTAIALSNTSVPENSPVATPVGTFSSTDSNPGDTFTYTLVSGTGSAGNSSFTIVGNQLRTAAVFDYELTNSYGIRVRTTDQNGMWFEQVFTIHVTDVFEATVNHAPVLNNAGTPALDPLIQNQSLATNNGTLISELILRMEPAGGISDADLDPIGIAINGVSNTYGSWQYTVNSGTNWTPITSAGNSNALLLAADSNTRLRFIPNANFIGSAIFAFVAWDRTTGANGGTANVASRGGSKAFSLGYEIGTIHVNNSAPVLNTSGTPVLDSIPMNVYGVDNTGTLVSEIITRMGPFGGITDPNPGALQGIAINGLGNTATGDWQYTTNGGSSWHLIGTTGNANARLLAADPNTRIRYVPQVGYFGSAIFSFVAWDRTSGGNGAVVGAGTRGGTTPFSTDFEYASISIVNSAPVLNDAGNPLLDGILPNIPDGSNPGTLVSDLIYRMYPAGGITDANPYALRGIAIIGKSGTGTWEFSTNNGSSWSTINSTSAVNSTLLGSDANTRVRYRPAAGFVGEAKIAFVAWDQSSGTNGTVVNASTRGGSTAFSTAFEYASIFVNTAPTLNNAGTPTLDAISNTLPASSNSGILVSTLISRMGPSGGITDPDPAALKGLAIIGQTGAATGSWQFSTNGGTSWSNITSTGSANALLLASDTTTRIRYVPNAGFTGTVAIAFAAWDRSQWSNGSIVNAGARGGATPFSTDYDLATITITA